MTMVHEPLPPAGDENAPRKGFGLWLSKHRRSMILLGAAIALAGYFLKDVAKEGVQDHLAAIHAGAAEYRTNLPFLEQQTAELVSAESLVEGDASSLPRDKVALALAKLTYGQELDANELFAFWKSFSQVPTSNLSEVRQLVQATGAVTDDEQRFLEHPPAAPPAFQTGARSLLHQLRELNDRTGKAGADLEVLAMEESERLERRSSSFGWSITLLTLCGLALTVVSSLYGVEVPKAE